MYLKSLKIKQKAQARPMWNGVNSSAGFRVGEAVSYMKLGGPC